MIFYLIRCFIFEKFDWMFLKENLKSLFLFFDVQRSHSDIQVGELESEEEQDTKSTKKIGNDSWEIVADKGNSVVDENAHQKGSPFDSSSEKSFKLGS